MMKIWTIKTVNHANPTDDEDAATSSMPLKKPTQPIYSLFCGSMWAEVSLLRHSSTKKQRVDITQTTSQTGKYFIIITLVLLLSINQVEPCNRKK